MANHDKDTVTQNSRVSRGPGPMQGVEKANNFKQAMGKLIRYSKGHIGSILVAVLFAIAGVILLVMGPGKLMDMTDLIEAGLMTGIDLDAIAEVGIVLVIMYGSCWVLSAVQGLIMAKTTQEITRSLRRDISTKINVLPMSYFAKNSVGDVLSRVSNDADTIGQSLNSSVSSLITAVIQLVATTIMMFVTNAIMATTAVLASILGFASMIVIMGMSQKYFAAQQRILGDINGNIEESYTGHVTIKAYGNEDNVKSTFDNMNVKMKKTAFRAQAFSSLMPSLMSFIGNLGYVAVCIVGAVLVFNDNISFSVIVAFMIYVRLFTMPLSNIAQATQQMQSAAAASERVFDMLEQPQMPDEQDTHLAIEGTSGNVDFVNVKFGYDSDKVIINDFSLSVKAKQKIAIVGHTGAGKTTLVNLLMRFYDVNSGDILIDGTSIYDMTREQVHNHFCMVLQDSWLFEGTVRENLVYSQTNVSDDTVKQALEAVGISHFVRTLPHGLDTVLDDNTALSVGQKQQLTIARAIIANKPMLILDEATSSVDTRTEQKIQQAMDSLMTDRTSFVIAHRLSTIKNADVILVLKDGDVVERGTHEQLLLANGVYAELYNSQFEQD